MFPVTFHTLTVDGLTPRGEGHVVLEGQEFAVPFVLPGDVIDVEEYFKTKKMRSLKLCAVKKEGTPRAKLSCQHFGTCGGCLLQHFTPEHYTAFKKALVTGALEAVGLESAIVAEPIIVGPGQRRRIDFMARLWDGEVRMGFHEAASKKPFNIKECPLLHPDIPPLFEPLRRAITPILQRERLLHFFVTRAQNGLDFLMAGLKEALLPEEEAGLVALANTHPIVRLAYKVKKKEKVLVESESPTVRFGDHDVPVTAFGFLQATVASDHLFAAFIKKHFPAKKTLSIADLFCGRGTLSLALTQLGHRVTGVECDGQALQALQTVPEPLLCIQERNLFETPLIAKELDAFDAVVMNPPRAGAETQTKQLALSSVKRLIYISCNMESFARDAHLLHDHGFKIREMVPVDQFLWTPHIEVMAYLERV